MVREEAALLRTYGYEVDDLSGQELRNREPALRDEVIGGVHYRDGAIADPGRFVTELADCLPEHGVTIKSNLEIKKIHVEDGRFRSVRTAGGDVIEADRLVLAAGVWSAEVARTIGVHIPLQGGKGYHVNLTPPAITPTHGMVCAETYVAVTPMGGKLRLAGTVEFSGINEDLNERRINMLPAGARKYVKGIGTSQSLSTWTGLRPCTADGLPVVGVCPGAEGSFIATGHAMMGFTLGPVTGQLISELMVDGAPSIDIDLLSPERFGPQR
jgi:D-amino-acid dehydrogenase